jgi:DNA repair photolyase
MISITKNSLLYKSKVEYADYSINHILGCSHGCRFPCYAMIMAKRFGWVKNYNEWIKPKIVSNALELLDKEILKYKDDIKFVPLWSFLNHWGSITVMLHY